ncbi:HlyD family type I secretion periplasmic adaptor subunit [Roseovarius sp. SCSIO 43702]|uniref:HlyD family type I secretion periplasmic adaptor subunit n=1 Tax=Roseovarius sp. SCSIO 43702 TaxID=2823043 RepID=UPI001C72DCBD|nr:HlyD family type I secretion periplasmic adaptor subunit [Roseovarius sp. SCSIO 43702]QYX56605.1 HlyD family type I secretion periplasmic adaptor subunit [Roseovarius sp. SCSIO 43702]
MNRRATSPGAARGPVLVACAVLAILLAGVGGWGVTARIAGAFIAPGTVDFASGRQVVQHPEGGVVARLHVRDGDRVAAGDVLVTLEAGALAAERAVAEARLFELLARRARLEAARDAGAAPAFGAELRAAAARPEVGELMAGQRRLHAAWAEARAAERREFDRRLRQLARQVAESRKQAAALDRQAALIAEELAGQEALLSGGLVPAARVLALRREAARLEGARAELRAAMAGMEGDMAGIAIERKRRAAREREATIGQLRDLRHTEIETRERLAALGARIGRLDLRAPVGGVVHGLRIHARQAVLRPAEPVLAIVPDGERPQVMARIRPADIDRLRAGQAVGLRLGATSARDAPRLAGRVRVISAHLVDDNGGDAPYYRAEIALDPGEERRLPDGVTLVPGMPVEAFFTTGERTPLAYLAEPLTRYFATAFRE